MLDERISHLRDVHSLLVSLAEHIGGARRLATCSGRLRWPRRGVYFFMEEGENRSDSGNGLRTVRVGTHALKKDSGTKLWTRLSQHRGQEGTGRGNHRGSIFRLLVGTSIIARNGHKFPTWGEGNNAPADVRAGDVRRFISSGLFRAFQERLPMSEDDSVMARIVPNVQRFATVIVPTSQQRQVQGRQCWAQYWR
jgi:hypothetical protein